MNLNLMLRGDIDALVSQAPAAVESFSPGHWAFMQDLERRVIEVIRNQDAEAFVRFLCDTAFLKQPYSVDRNRVRSSLSRYPAEIAKSLSALRRIDELDYGVMDALAELPWFGRNGGRAFNSAVLRLVRPQSFGIIDWRNLAVMLGAPGFEGLVHPAVTFPEISTGELLEQKGELRFTQVIYVHYNDVLRQLAARYQRPVGDIDLILWMYSIHRRPFPAVKGYKVQYGLHISPADRQRLRSVHRPAVVKQIVEDYLDRLRELGYLRRDLLVEELCSLFSLIRDECETFGRGKPGRVQSTVRRVVLALDQAIKTKDRYRLLFQWDRWKNMIDTTSSAWRGNSLPGAMIEQGYMVFEDFEPIKKYFYNIYNPGSLEPVTQPD
jgi:hypothetical protein